ncbi:MAG TPA: hypothetical protein VI386_01315, partial [Candidatus Sulfotelmatobacter sp.]
LDSSQPEAPHFGADQREIADRIVVRAGVSAADVIELEVFGVALPPTVTAPTGRPAMNEGAFMVASLAEVTRTRISDCRQGYKIWRKDMRLSRAQHLFPQALSVQAVRELSFYGSYLLLLPGIWRDRFGSPYLTVCAGKRIGESILVCLVAPIETGEVFFDNHIK